MAKEETHKHTNTRLIYTRKPKIIITTTTNYNTTYLYLHLFIAFFIHRIFFSALQCLFFSLAPTCVIQTKKNSLTY